MRPCKYDTHIQPHIDKIVEWTKQGATEKEMAKNLGVAVSTLKKYVLAGKKGDERYKELSDAFAQACDFADDKVEAALYKRACGIEYDEVTMEEKLDRDGNVHKLTKIIHKTVPPDPTSATFWLVNRRPERWAWRKNETVTDGNSGNTGVVEIPAVLEESKDA